jgi:hypothetical protein
MTVQEAITRAESLIDRPAAPEGEIDPRWQAIIAVGEFIEAEPEPVWAFVLRWGSSPDADLRMAIATCLLEHLLEYHFDAFITRVEDAAQADPRFGDMATGCWEFGQTEDPERSARLERLINSVSARAARTQVTLLRYLELKTGYHDNGPAWIGYVTMSHSGRTLYFNGKAFRRSKRAISGNHYDVETGENYWISGVKKRGSDRHWAGSGKITIEAAAVQEYLSTTCATELDGSRFLVSDDIKPTDIARFHEAENARLRDSES